MPLSFYVADLVMTLAALGGVAASVAEATHLVIPRWRLLLPGAFATISTTMLVAYPELRDLLELQRLTIGVAVFVVGIARGRWLTMTSDQTRDLVRLEKSVDVLVVACCQVLLALVVFVLEVATRAEARFEPTLELLMIMAASYQLGRALGGWYEAGQVDHVDLET